MLGPDEDWLLTEEDVRQQFVKAPLAPRHVAQPPPITPVKKRAGAAWSPMVGGMCTGEKQTKNDLTSTLRAWLRNHSTWRAAAKLGEGFKGSWLCMRRDSGIGCKACAWAQEQQGNVECEEIGRAHV